jgi:D-alanyl-lipoteichoic acid acyltransferase DltB (MBOAT superfamily)
VLFNTAEYLAFFLLVLFMSWITAGFLRFRTWFILVASFYFYTSNNHWQILLLLTTTTVDYFICLRLGKTDKENIRKYLVAISIVSNLGMLAYFKYAGFFSANLQAIASVIGWHLNWVDLNIILPVGISFYTFEALSYTIDVYRRKIPPEKDWARLAFLVSFFPHLIAGPIVRAHNFFPQIGRRPHLTVIEVERALLLVFSGLIKKIIFADTLGGYADKAFNFPNEIDSFEAWLGIYAFMFQIYFDFSGYTDIALGCAKLLGFDLPENFRRPYAAVSFTDFWHRWHISLSSWLRDYLYISLGGNRMKSKLGVYRNLMITMLLGGLWHGASWHFVIWGAVHGCFLSFERLTGIVGKQQVLTIGKRALSSAVFIQLILLTWIIFRSPDLTRMGLLFEALTRFTIEHNITVGMFMAILLMIAAWMWQLMNESVFIKEYWINKVSVPVKASSYAAVFCAVILLNSLVPRTFIYFQF